ncbi:hypothetical protein KJ953_04190 [Patescibacteria group bacterium]|nr:hypothetical protein [Patescibacteria group bacterium]MBU1256726.1 hypothetical protein [Patescibacteria group bacterium]MBU1457211.1 hypothetical protein [Patescibacteria group bacterium]
MSIIFYDHLINKQEILVLIDQAEGEDNHKSKIKQLVDDILHQGIVDFALNKLKPKHHQTFLSHLHNAPYDPEILDYLKEKIAQDIEEQVQNYADQLIKKIRHDLGL